MASGLSEHSKSGKAYDKARTAVLGKTTFFNARYFLNKLYYREKI